MSTLIAFEVSTYASKHDQRTITVMARNKAAAAAAAVAGHRAIAGLPANATVLTTRIDEVTVNAQAPRPMTKGEQLFLAKLRRELLLSDGDDAA